MWVLERVLTATAGGSRDLESWVEELGLQLESCGEWDEWETENQAGPLDTLVGMGEQLKGIQGGG